MPDVSTTAPPSKPLKVARQAGPRPHREPPTAKSVVPASTARASGGKAARGTRPEPYHSTPMGDSPISSDSPQVRALWGVRVVSQTKSRKTPIRKILPAFFWRAGKQPDTGAQSGGGGGGGVLLRSESGGHSYLDGFSVPNEVSCRGVYTPRAVQFHPNGGQSEFGRLTTRASGPHRAHVWRAKRTRIDRCSRIIVPRPSRHRGSQRRPAQLGPGCESSHALMQHCMSRARVELGPKCESSRGPERRYMRGARLGPRCESRRQAPKFCWPLRLRLTFGLWEEPRHAQSRISPLARCVHHARASHASL